MIAINTFVDTSTVNRILAIDTSKVKNNLYEEEKRELKELRKKIKGFKKDEKIFLDAVSNSQVKVLLTTDREHSLREFDRVASGKRSISFLISFPLQ